MNRGDTCSARAELAAALRSHAQEQSHRVRQGQSEDPQQSPSIKLVN